MNEERKIKLNINPEVANGKYSNILASSFNKEEFVLDFGFILPQTEQANIHSRIILNADNAKLLLNALKNNLEKYDTLKKNTDNNINEFKISSN